MRWERCCLQRFPCLLVEEELEGGAHKLSSAVCTRLPSQTYTCKQSIVVVKSFHCGFTQNFLELLKHTHSSLHVTDSILDLAIIISSILIEISWPQKQYQCYLHKWSLPAMSWALTQPQQHLPDLLLSMHSVVPLLPMSYLCQLHNFFP